MWILILLLVCNWVLIFTIPYIVAWILTFTKGISSHKMVRGVWYLTKEYDSRIDKLLQKLGVKKNFSFGIIIYFDTKWFDGNNFEDSITFRRLEVHERMHVKQQLYLGAVQWITYLVFYAIMGYKKNPYEVQARNAESDVK